MHIHPRAQESYEVIDGTLEVFLDGAWRTLRAGEKTTVAPGHPHTLKNASAEPVRLINIHRPALRFEAMFRELQALITTGQIKRLPPTDPRSLIYAGMLFAKYPDEQRMTKPPTAALNALALLGHRLRLTLDT